MIHGEEMAEIKGINSALSATNAGLEADNHKLKHKALKLEARKAQLKDGYVKLRNLSYGYLLRFFS